MAAQRRMFAEGGMKSCPLAGAWGLQRGATVQHPALANQIIHMWKLGGNSL